MQVQIAQSVMHLHQKPDLWQSGEKCKALIGCMAWPRLVSQISGHGLVEQACSCLATFGSSRRTRMSLSESFADDRSMFSKLFRLSSISKSSDSRPLTTLSRPRQERFSSRAVSQRRDLSLGIDNSSCLLGVVAARSVSAVMAPTGL
jgi:hypothetical protein